MAEALMTLQYEGEAVALGQMDVRTLAPALIAAADAMREAHQLLRAPGPPPQVTVRATRPGSFIVDLLVADPHGIIQQAIEVLNSSEAKAGINLGKIVSLVLGSLKLIKGLRNRKITTTEEVRPGLIRLILEDGTVIETPPESLQLVLDSNYRQAVQGMVEPLNAPGVDSLTASSEGVTEDVTTADLGAFRVPPAVEEPLLDVVAEAVLRPVSVSFSEGNKWRFSDGDATFFAGIEDPTFAHAVEVGTERFAKNDMLRVQLRTRQTKVEGGLRTERTILHVLEHIPGATQLDLFTSDAGGDFQPRDDSPDGTDGEASHEEDQDDFEDGADGRDHRIEEQ